jgi:hypothetical protein
MYKNGMGREGNVVGMDGFDHLAVRGHHFIVVFVISRSNTYVHIIINV